MDNEGSTKEPVVLEPTYSFSDAILQSIAAEDMFGYLDIGPIDTLDDTTFKSQYEAFFGLSPLPSPTPSPPTSRPTTPDREAYERELDLSFGTSPLSTPPDTPCSSRPSSPSALPQRPLIDAPQLNSKARRNRRKGSERRKTTRKSVREKEDKISKPYANSLKHVSKAACTQTTYDTRDIPSASTGFVALPDVDYGRIAGHKELLEGGTFRLIKWCGGSTKAVVDKDGRVVLVLAGHPNDVNWAAVHRSAHSALISARRRCRFPRKAVRHRRGDFPVLSAGISFGGGQTAPGNLKHSNVNAEELERLLRHPSFLRIAGFASSAFHTWAPKLHTHYAQHLNSLLKDHPNLRRNFSNSVWSATAFNFGPRTYTKKHRDAANLPYGWCAITALGDFDPTNGGHLVLWDLGLIIEFPAGSTILLPSAAIAHSNTPIQPGERRCSFTQFTAGGLFRWAAHGNQKDSEYFSDKTAEDMARIAAENEARCKLGLSLFSTFEEIQEELRQRGCGGRRKST